MQNPTETTRDWEACLTRLGRLAGSDEGFFVLAVHSLIEAWLNEQDPDFNARDTAWNFFSKVNAHLERRMEKGFVPYVQPLRSFKDTYELTNGVRHNFGTVDRALIARVTAMLCGFSAKAGLGSAQTLETLKQLAARWQTPEDTQNLASALLQLQRQLEALKTDQASVQAQLLEAERLREENRAQAVEVESLLQRIQSVEAIKEKRDEKLKVLRAELNEVQRRQSETVRRLAESQAASECLEQLLNVHGISRSRLEYEQTLIRLSEEQEQALRFFKRGQSFLIRGGAGTGKTLVLLAAVRKLRSDEASQFAFDQPAKVLLLSFTRTLRNYTHYLSQLMAPDTNLLEVETVDAFFRSLWQTVFGTQVTVNFQLRPSDLGSSLAGPEWEELENFVWARGLTEEEYVVQRIPRVGRRTPLSADRRAAVWREGEQLLHRMQAQNLYSRNGHRHLLKHKLLQTKQEGDQVLPWDVLAVDEVQDLAPVEIQILAQLSGSLLMAGDAGQSLYRSGFRFQDSGVDIAGRSRVLKLSFRSTRPLEKLARTFVQSLQGIAEAAELTDTEARREGLPPRLLRYSKRQGWEQVLSDSIEFYTTVLRYQESSIAILTAENTVADKVTAFLQQRQRHCLRIQEDLDWMHRDGVRVSTIHSAKGLDFPCVITLLPALHRDDELTEELRYRSQANLVYVGITRALENQTVILPEETSSTVLRALAAAFEG